ncbi:hypothetical protein EON63_05365 [archaeon]|nr:MAG: hypothetical protein EON63_05365 [archaeon]
MCTTGFTLTYTLRELELQSALGNHTALDIPSIPRICSNNFKQYGGNVKAFWTGGDSSHYMKYMQKHKHIHILHTYTPLNLAKVVNFLHRKVVMGDTGKGVYLVYGGKKYTFNSYDKFLEMGYSDRGTRHVGDHILNQIPDGGDVASIEQDVRAEQAGKLPAPVQFANPTPTTSSISVPQVSVPTTLTKAIQSINAQNTTTCFSDDYDGTRDDYLQDRHKSILGDMPVLVHPLCTNTFQLGNTLGYYLNDIACADIAGAHFIAVTKKFNIILPDTLYTYPNTANMLAFFQHLPDLITHSTPNPPDQAKKIMKDTCHCLQFCWENSEAPWIQRIPLVRRTLLPAVTAYLSASNAEHLGTLLSNETDRVYIPADMQTAHKVSYEQNPTYKLTPALSKLHLPLQPNVTIQYRCGDNIGFGKTKYGLLPFSVYNRIPHNAYKHIYIIADSPQRNSAHVYSYRCETILDHLVAYLVKRHPNSVVALKRGGDVFLDYARIMNSNMVFCSASTFCLWPALSNEVGQVHFPLTPLIAKAATNVTAPKFKENFHWVGEVEMIKQFKHYRPWTKLIDELETL